NLRSKRARRLARPAIESINCKCQISNFRFRFRLQIQVQIAYSDSNSKRVAEVSYSDQAADHDYETYDRSERGGSPAPACINPGLDDHQIKEPGNYREDFQRSRLPVHVITRVGIPETIDDAQGHQHKPDCHRAGAYRIASIERRKFVKDCAKPFVS